MSISFPVGIKENSALNVLPGNISVSLANSKTGPVASISLLPEYSCDKSMPCYIKGCYAKKMLHIRTSLKDSWVKNTTILKQSPVDYFNQLSDRLSRLRWTSLFRFHIGGDIPDSQYLGNMISLAEKHDRMKFLTFTKKYKLLQECKEKIPDNLSIVLSAWPGVDLPEDLRERFPVAYMRDTRKYKYVVQDQRIPPNVHECDGGCATCGLCWGIKPHESVVFNYH